MTIALSRLNFRDLGGLAAGLDARVRSGLIFRSEGPASFFDEHRAELGAMGFRTVCDLRSRVERDHAPNDWCGPDCRVLDLDMNTDLRAQGEDIWESLRGDASVANARRVMTENYRMMPAALLPHWPPIVAALMAGDVPMMVHCTAGKDRTGVAIAILLACLGVSHADIVADFGKSDVFGDNMRVAGSVEAGFRDTFGFVPDQAVVAMLIGTDAAFLTGALAEVDHRWGGVEDYFAAAGIGADMRADLRAMLLEPR